MVVRKHNLVDIEGTLIHQTEKAFLIDVGKKDPVWVPKALAEYNEEDGTFTMPENIALEKELI